MLEEINFYSRKHEFGWLSNFWLAKQVVEGKEYPTNEHYYQSMKATDEDMREWIRKTPTPYHAMKAGRNLRPTKMEINIHEWERKKDEVMLTGLRAKFSQNPELKELLLATGDAVLHEDSPYDTYWGKRGQDKLGRLLMQVREELRRD